MKITKLIAVFNIAILTFEACSGDDGIDGIDGSQGPAGQNGNANVIVSEWKSATGPKDTIIDNTQIKVATIAAPELTENIIENSAIMVYLDYNAGLFILPHTSRPSGRMTTISFFPQKGKIRPTRIVYDGGTTLSIGSNLKFKYVIIPQGTNIPKNSTTNTAKPLYKLNYKLYTLDALKAMSYEEISSKLNIQESFKK